MVEQAWKPSREEAMFLGQLLAIDSGLAEIARGQLVKGIPLREVVAGFKAASDIARLVHSAPKLLPETYNG